MKRCVRFSGVMTVIILCCGLCAGPALAKTPLPVFVSIVPQQYFVQQIGKDKVAVSVMVQPGASPATYEPKPAQMAKLSSTRLYFSIGVPFETFWLDKIASANPDMTLVHTDKGIEKQPMGRHHHHDHKPHTKGSHGHIHDHEHGHKNNHDPAGLDPHIWLSPRRVKIQAGHILDALVTADPENSAFYTANHHAFIEELDALDRDLTRQFDAYAGMQFMVFHPSWGYFARDYKLKMIPVEVEGKNPKPAKLHALIHHAREKGIRVIFVQPQFSTKSAALVAREINGQVMPADPLALAWMDNMKKVAGQFREVLK